MLFRNAKIRVAMPHDYEELDYMAGRYHLGLRNNDGSIRSVFDPNWTFNFTVLDKIKMVQFLIRNEFNLKRLFDEFNDKSMYLDLFSDVRYGLGILNIDNRALYSLGISNHGELIEYATKELISDLSQDVYTNRILGVKMNEVAYLPHKAFDMIMDTLGKQKYPLFESDTIRFIDGHLRWDVTNTCEYGANIKRDSEYCIEKGD